uniref:Adaptin_N domain-containing protein n=1 Tax=Gongylonema pulchrum TaxID=637853 RepID=A0A183DCJ3_9BILA
LKHFACGKLSIARIANIYGELVNRLSDPNDELPVKVEAAIAIQHVLEGQARCLPEVKNRSTADRSMLKPHIRVVVIEVLRLVARAEIEEMTGVMDALLEEFVDDIIPIAVDVATELVTFAFWISHRDACG